ncbi:hypothetical protein GGR28_000788 [Lewinella aquimaris]|uniref:DUF4440 domain-containing protein n=1 Tax=Neolewinella aquimaris TaxID=1835722 RepID=A0A840E4Y0_9BACT|nr:nuclear transport factor 2 family protein [Neolewinella aquimaris]MBB4078187.1 hypothetical protein [Neolewinella aquimaris]
MKYILCALLSGIFLSTCGPAQMEDGLPDVEKRILRAEKLFNGAYENLDAAIMERLLTEDFTIGYADAAPSKNREQFVAELGSLRQVFPHLQISIDSTVYTVTEDRVTVVGVRTFTWQQEGVTGEHRESFENVWHLVGNQWKLAATTLAKYPE